MGLDAVIRKLPHIYKKNEDGYKEHDLIEFRNFCPFDFWIRKNCEKINHEYRDLWKLTPDDLYNFKNYVDKTDDKWWFNKDGKNDYSKGFDDLYIFIDTIKDSPNDMYYYEPSY